MRAPGRLIAVAMVPCGTVAGHVLGYLLAGEGASLSGSHSHLRPAGWVAAAVAATALAAVALVVPSPERRSLRLSSLASAQVVLFGLLELTEHLHAGHGALSCLHEASFRWGVGAQLVSAGLMIAVVRLARTSGACVRALLARRSRRRWAAEPGPCWSRLRTVVRCLVPGSSVSERGPPSRPALA